MMLKEGKRSTEKEVVGNDRGWYKEGVGVDICEENIGDQIKVEDYGST